jgi:hypothetical protein
MGTWLEYAGGGGIQVRAVVSRNLATNVTAQSDSGLLDDIAKAIAIEKEGRPLPDAAP